MKRFWRTIAGGGCRIPTINPLSCRIRYEWRTKGIDSVGDKHEVREITPLRICFDPKKEALVLLQQPDSSSSNASGRELLHAMLAKHHTMHARCQHQEQHDNVGRWTLLKDCQLETLRRLGSIGSFLQGTCVNGAGNFLVDLKGKDSCASKATGMTLQSIPLAAASYSAFVTTDRGASLRSDVFSKAAIESGVSQEDATLQWQQVEHQGVRRCGVIDLEAAGVGENVAFFLSEEDLQELHTKVFVTGAPVMRREVETKWPAVQELLERFGVKVDGLRTPWFIWTDELLDASSPSSSITEMVLKACDEICWDV